jgi:hypothetical protein
VGGGGDAIDYFSAADSLIAGRGFVSLGAPGWRTFGNFPPLYPLVLSTCGLFHMTPLAGARYLHAALFLITIMTAGWIAFRFTRSMICAGATALLTLDALLQMFSRGESEPLFIFLVLCSCAAIGRYLSRPSPGSLVIASVFPALALQTRYAGFCVVGAGGIAILLLLRKPLARRLFDVLIFGLICGVPLLIWIVYVHSVNTAMGRSPGVHPPNAQKFQTLFNTVGAIVYPGHRTATRAVGLTSIGLIVAALLIGALWPRAREAAARAMRQRAGGYAMAALVLFGVLYLPFILLCMTFADAAIPFNFRILSPAIIPWMIIVLSVAWVVVSEGSRSLRFESAGAGRPAPGARRSMASIAICLIGLAAVAAGLAAQSLHTRQWALAAHKKGLDYRSARWQKSPMWKAIHQLPPDALIYTNAQDLLYFHTGRIARTMPQVYKRKSETPVRNVARACKPMVDQLIQRHGYLVFFNGVDRRDFLLNPDTLAEIRPDIHLNRLVDLHDARIPENSGFIATLSRQEDGVPTTRVAATAPATNTDARAPRRRHRDR